LPWTPTTWLVIAVFGVATFIRATFGFGEALIAVPVLAFVLPVEVVAPVAMLISITVAAVVVAQDWRHVHVRAAGKLVLSSMFGIPLGLILLRTGSEPIVKGSLGLIVAAFSASSLLKGGFPVLDTDRQAWMFGLTAGVLGGAYGLNGPPLVAYGTLRRWSPGRFRATLQGYFLPVSLMGMVGYGIAGLWTPTVTRYYLRSLPAVLVATMLGAWTSRRLPAARFLAYVHAGLIVIGTALVVQAIATAWR
jgi:uncharacterized protein